MLGLREGENAMGTARKGCPSFLLESRWRLQTQAGRTNICVNVLQSYLYQIMGPRPCTQGALPHQGRHPRK